MKFIIDILEERLDSIKHFGIKQNEVSMLERALINGTPLDEKEPTYEEVIEYCKKRHLCLVTYSFVNKLLNGGDK